MRVLVTSHTCSCGSRYTAKRRGLSPPLFAFVISDVPTSCYDPELVL
jgi:hypothetical protein